MLTGAWTKIDDVIRRAHRLLIVLDDDHGVTKVAELLECRDQTRIIALMKTDRGLVEYVQNSDEP